MPQRRSRIIDPSVFEVIGGEIVTMPLYIEGLPSGRIMEPILKFNPEVKQPTYSIYEVSRIFFGREKNYIWNIVWSEGWEKLSTHPDAVTPYESGVRWTLDEVERLIRILNDVDRISYTRAVIALHLVAWTARAHDLYV